MVIGWSAFGGAVLFALVVLGFCAYELTWKFRRLQRDLGGLQRVSADLDFTQRQLTALADRIQTARASASPDR